MPPDTADRPTGSVKLPQLPLHEAHGKAGVQQLAERSAVDARPLRVPRTCGLDISRAPPGPVSCGEAAAYCPAHCCQEGDRISAG